MKKLLICFMCVFCSCTTQAASKLQLVELCFTAANSVEKDCLPHKFEVSLAVTEKQQTKGLMFVRDSDLSEHQGMLFVFPNEAHRVFWMRNTYVSLDIIYIDADKNVVSLVENAATLSDTPLPSMFPAKYVVEIRGGLAKKIGITRGAKAVFELPITE